MSTFAPKTKKRIAVMKLVFATGNSGKLREASEILGEGFELVTPASMGLEEEIPETGSTISANSLQKARYIYDRLSCDCFADDTGLEVEVLSGEPGVNTARYAGPQHDPEDNMAKLLGSMDMRLMEASMAREFGVDTVHATRKARFRTVVTLFLGGEAHYFEGVLEGKIGLGKKGDGGFGYDPVFIPDLVPKGEITLPEGSSFTLEADGNGLVRNIFRLTLAQISEEGKNAISHRGKALGQMAEFLHNERS